jgi:hypothetical protein
MTIALQLTLLNVVLILLGIAALLFIIGIRR